MSSVGAGDKPTAADSEQAALFLDNDDELDLVVDAVFSGSFGASNVRAGSFTGRIARVAHRTLVGASHGQPCPQPTFTDPPAPSTSQRTWFTWFSHPFQALRVSSRIIWRRSDGLDSRMLNVE